MKYIINFIRAVVDAYIIHPIQRFLNFYFHGAYIPDNSRNQELLDYCIRVAKDPNVEPNTPNEIFFENTVKRDWEETFTDLEDKWEDNLVGLRCRRGDPALYARSPAALVPSPEPRYLHPDRFRDDGALPAVYKLRDRRALVFELRPARDGSGRAHPHRGGHAAQVRAQGLPVHLRRDDNPLGRLHGAGGVPAEPELPCARRVYLVVLSAYITAG